ncbi:hypothetical protein [Lactococcus protaetiae]|uniref:Uncharacterized protein n=1 Tax=Lactococcus protaetiae TaxID=2592653 RepID=A0A514ZB35_9LACT|nr:hypothetical protein [Lactococcus protaetiae]QDK71803.1 hypothetical protein FLP15_12260 [Lactococcus protaetiae]
MTELFADLFGDIIIQTLFGATKQGKSKKRFWIQGIFRTLIVLGFAIIVGIFALIVPQFITKLILIILSLGALVHYFYHTLESIKNYRRTYL